jgi:hypothetical protein
MKAKHAQLECRRQEFWQRCSQDMLQQLHTCFHALLDTASLTGAILVSLEYGH